MQGKELGYLACYDAFMALPDVLLTFFNVPIEVATAEAMELASAAKEDRIALLSAGIVPVFVDSLSDRVGAFTYAAARYQMVTVTDPEASRIWKELSPTGYTLQQYLIRMLGFAYRKDKVLSEAVERIREGRGSMDMVLDLLSLSILATENPKPLAAMPLFNAVKIAEAKNLHNRLSEVFARATTDPMEVAETKSILVHAYSYYKIAADEVKAHGQFVFEDTPRYQSYISKYRGSKSKKAAAEATAPAEIDEADIEYP